MHNPKQQLSFVRLPEVFVPSLTSHLAPAQSSCVFHHSLTVLDL